MLLAKQVKSATNETAMDQVEPVLPQDGFSLPTESESELTNEQSESTEKDASTSDSEV